MAEIIIAHRPDDRPGHEGETGYFVVILDGEVEKEIHGPMSLKDAQSYHDYRAMFPLMDPRD